MPSCKYDVIHKVPYYMQFEKINYFLLGNYYKILLNDCFGLQFKTLPDSLFKIYPWLNAEVSQKHQDFCKIHLEKFSRWIDNFLRFKKYFFVWYQGGSTHFSHKIPITSF